MTAADQVEKARQLAEMVRSDSNREGRALGFALGKFACVHTTTTADINENIAIEETSNDDNH